jgi:hypothetical protein
VLLTATNRVSSGDQQSEFQALAEAGVLDTQLIESSEYIIVPELLTANSTDNSGLQTTELQLLSTGFALDIQVDTQLLDTVIGVLNLFKVLFILVVSEFEPVDTVLNVIVLLDITLFPEPVFDTAANTFSSAAQHTAAQSLSTAVVSKVQVIPSGLVILLLPVPVFDTAINRASPEAQTTLVQL